MPTALLSVWDKTGLAEFAKKLVDRNWVLLASGGTARFLAQNHLPHREISQYTASPEVLGGRVKTLHPAIHAGILARPTAEDFRQLSELGWEPIDLVVVNLYPFEQTIAQPNVSLNEAIENIDIGGVALLRAAAKNWQRVTVCFDPKDYPRILDEIERGEVSLHTRRTLAAKTFALTARYDSLIADFLSQQASLSLHLFPILQLQYGENPHQQAELFSEQPLSQPFGGRVLQGKALSYNNLLDLDAAWRAVSLFDDPCVVIVKHLSPCGIACADNLEEAYQSALASDPISAFGGVIAFNREVSDKTAELMNDLFIECMIAPAFSVSAREVLSAKKNCRLIEAPLSPQSTKYEYRSIVGGLLRQTVDFGDPPMTTWKVVSRREPTPAEWKALRFAWKAVQPVKSNAIVIAQGTATVGIGSGQPNRVDAVRIALQRAAERAHGAVLASDAFFPFPDSVEIAAQAGITAIIHPGGSIRDADSLAVADAANMAMVYTGVRHFRH
ncbi:MAG: bifunctional phosphoribosylaminoimidazolecarboxamide formyltransferase/IMP cyclohydrolase PurH [Anaerolineae bacterium]|jgi:phosphoribosylaminoimidazolecarboxamide formyltransferase/IMP cyclohydrolase|nr:MAG: bifunctional phosphoribosylaminoimidazolecarboxamide formyltransferase/IMP cyclohydrolase PurH [Anaerolineae bacterium]